MTHSEHSILIGVDGGGTGCRVAVGTLADGVLAQAEGGPANATSDIALAIQNVASTIEVALKTAGLSASDATVHVGLAGVMGRNEVDKIAAAFPYKTITVTDDRPTAITGALGGKDGYLLSIGTGSIAAASKVSKFAYVGGWGFQVSDHASGAWLGRAALEQVLLCFDGLAEHTALTREIFKKYNQDPNKIVTFCQSATPRDYAALAPDIIKGAQENDPWGRAIMGKGAAFLMRNLTRLGFQNGDTLCLSGGVGPHYADYLPKGANQGLIPAQGSALDGAFQLAKQALMDRLEQQA
ncbi:MAG: hypothetical protein MUR46_05840 [Loktanella sp.]|jgi:glucosamine kinase|nr:hypothetical protein [Loktanella sp.]MDO7608381.1 hypothetical protein [Loktanella sp.]MDO7622020.1 hypothetical protein [Loktanella sp.]MDO7625312.1 hypothetical protein [Loktanella sp.]MDO7664264.1 hypothetical protein [Loktanella sp.]